MRNDYLRMVLITIFCVASICGEAIAQKELPPFKWVNEREGALPSGVSQATFRSRSMGGDVGYCIFLPPGYIEDTGKRYPVVYHLHGGRPGSELKSVQLARFVDRAIRAGEIGPTI